MAHVAELSFAAQMAQGLREEHRENKQTTSRFSSLVNNRTNATISDRYPATLAQDCHGAAKRPQAQLA